MCIRDRSWLDPFLRHVERLAELRARVEVVQLGGATGTLASLAPHGLEIREYLAKRLGLANPPISWHAGRDRIVEVVTWAAQVSASLAKIGLDIALGSQTEFGELTEGSGGISSTMPQKRNPIQSQQLIRAAKLTRTHVDLVLDAAIADHDRATAGWSLEWNSVAPSLAIAGGAVEVAVDLIDKLQVNPDAMAHNLEKTNGLIMAEAVMMKLAPDLGRQAAHDVVAEMVNQSAQTQRSFVEVTKERFPDADLPLDPAAYTGHAIEQINAVVTRAHQLLREPA